MESNNFISYHRKIRSLSRHLCHVCTSLPLIPASLPHFISFFWYRWISTLRDKCAIPVKNEILPELRDFSPGPPLASVQDNQAPVNVVIADFIEMDNAIFSRTIIELNLKLLKNVDLIYHSQG